MKQKLYICNRCKDEGIEFSVPADEFGVEFMKAHLWEKHKLNVDHRKAQDPEEEIYLD